MKSFTVILLSMCFASCVFAQKAGVDFSKAFNAYLSDYLTIDFEVKVFKDKNDQVGKVQSSGMIRKSKGNYYSKSGTTEMITNKEGTLVIDHHRKTMQLMKGHIFKTAELMDQFSMDTLLLEGADSVRYAGMVNGKKKYLIYDNSAPVYKTELLLDPASGFVAEIVYYYKESNKEEEYDMHKMVLSYKKVSTSPGISSNWFSFGKFIASKGSTFLPSPGYSSYRLNVIDTKSK